MLSYTNLDSEGLLSSEIPEKNGILENNLKMQECWEMISMYGLQFEYYR